MLALISTISASYFACFGYPDTKTFTALDAVMELFFLADIITHFFLQYNDEGELKPVRDITKIAARYMKNMFIFDFLATFPFRYAISSENMRARRLSYLLKLLRLPKIAAVLDTKTFQEVVKSFFKRRLKNVIKNP